MLTHSLFRVTCICGEELRSESKVGTCPTCKCEFRIEWPAEYEGEQSKQKEPVTVGRAATAVA
jgi:hypothetical protein